MVAASGLDTRAIIDEILSDPDIRATLGRFTADLQHRFEAMENTINTALGDDSFRRVLSGSTWLNGVSILNGTVTADKISVNTLEAVQTNTGSLNVTGTITIAPSFPATAQRITLNSSGILGYNSAVTNTFGLNTDGSGFIGVGGTAMSWTTAGVVTIPVAAIGSLTIAAVGSGVLGGTYKTSATTTRIELSTTGIVAYNAGTETFRLETSTGAMTATGSFTVLSAATGAHVKIDNAGGIAGYNATSEIAGNRTFLLNAATGSGHLGSSTNGISWDSSGTVSIGGASFSSGKITASSLSISTLAAITADLGTITAGTINASLITVSNLSFTHMQQAGTLGAGQSLGANDITVNSTGKIKFGASSADYLSNNILHFEVSTTETARVEFKNASNTPYSGISGAASSTLGALYAGGIYDSNIGARGWFEAQSTGGLITLYATHTVGSKDATIQLVTSNTTASNHIVLSVNNANHTDFVATNRAIKAYGYFYPGTGSATQSTGYIGWNATNGSLHYYGAPFQSDFGVLPGYAGTPQFVNQLTGSSTTLDVRLGNTTSSYLFRVINATPTVRFAVAADGQVQIGSAVRDDAATSVSTLTSVWAIYDVGGSLVGYIPIYGSYS